LSTAGLAPSVRQELSALPYCNVLNGMAFPPDDCPSTEAGWPNAARFPTRHPCRDQADLAQWPAYERKVEALRAMMRRLQAEGVQVIVLQEVFDDAAVRQILPEGWSVRSTRGLAGSPDVPQQLAIAWRAPVQVRAVSAYGALSDSGVPGRALRPGLQFTLAWQDREIEGLAVHLKAGCRNRVIDAPLRPNDKPERLDAIATDCAMFRYQLPALEAWVDARAGREFVVLGDFNRSIFLEPIRERPERPVRLDGSSTASPLGPCTMEQDGLRQVVRCPSRTSALFPELNDNDPPGAVLWRASFPEQRGGRIRAGSVGDCAIHGVRRVKGKPVELTHDGIDHILLSDALKRRLAPEALHLRMMGWRNDSGGAWVIGPDELAPSDHCPHWVVLG
jgi:hypothetical protein